MTWPTGHQLQGGKYVIQKIIGQGGFGITYKALQVKLNRLVVIKTPNEHLQYDPEYDKYVNRFIQEGRILARLSQNRHPHIVGVIELFHEDTTHCLVMEFIDGENLFQLVRRRGALPANEIVHCICQIASALNMVHESGLVHRDAHPGNIMLQNDGKAVLIDFGIAKQIIPATQSSTDKAAHDGFAPYEQKYKGSRDPKVDIYCLAASLYYGVTGEKPTNSLARKLENEPLIPPQKIVPSISNTLNQAILKGMALEAKDRPQSMQEWLQILSDEESTSTDIPPVSSTLSVISRRRFLQTAGLFVGGVTIAVVGRNLLQPNQTTSISTNPKSPTPTPTSEKTPPANNLKTLNIELVKTNSQGSIISTSNSSVRYFEENLGNGVILQMMEIPGGTFMMGSPENEQGKDDDESPQHQVTVPSFFMARYQLTQAQYQAIMANNPSYVEGGNRPVERVSWNDAVEFCKRLSQKTGKNYRLPSEAEWEYACRAGTTTPFYFGESITPDLVNYNGNLPYASAPKGEYRRQTTDVGTFPPNAFGLYDMHGNVWEWCQDTWHKNYINAPTNGSAWISQNNKFSKSELYSVLRGGSWGSSAWFCRSGNRGRLSRVNGNGSVGFRVAVIR